MPKQDKHSDVAKNARRLVNTALTQGLTDRVRPRISVAAEAVELSRESGTPNSPGEEHFDVVNVQGAAPTRASTTIKANAPARRVAPRKRAPNEAHPAREKGKRQRVRPETRAQMLERLTNPLVTLHEASVLLRVCTATVRRYSNSGQLAHLRTEGGQRRFFLKDVLNLLKDIENRKK